LTQLSYTQELIFKSAKHHLLTGQEVLMLIHLSNFKAFNRISRLRTTLKLQVLIKLKEHLTQELLQQMKRRQLATHSKTS